MKSKTFLWETYKLKFLITNSRTLPKEWKYTIKYHLINKFELYDISLIKGLIHNIIFENAYDIFTSSILTLHYRNWLSYQILTRAQIEIFLFTHWLKENPEKIKNIFTEELFDYSKYQKEFYKSEKDPFIHSVIDAYYVYYSKKAHPLPTRFLSSISFWGMMKPRKENIDISLILNKSFNKLPEAERKKKIDEMFEFGGYSPGIKSQPHLKKKEKEIIGDVAIMISLFTEIKKNLDSIERDCENFKMTDKDWDHSRRKYQKDSDH